MTLRSVKTSHATTNMAICIPAEINMYIRILQCIVGTIQMKPCRAAIIQYNARNYIIALWQTATNLYSKHSNF